MSMSKNNISDALIVETSARISNKVGLDNLSLKRIADELNIKSPSLYNHISGLEEIKIQLMFYGWKQMEEKMIDSAVGVAGYEALKNMCSMIMLQRIKVFLPLCFGITNMKVQKGLMLLPDYLLCYLK